MKVHFTRVLLASADFEIRVGKYTGRVSYLKVNICFIFRNSSNQYILLDKNGKTIQPNLTVKFSKSPFKIITHGWKSSADTPSVQLIADAYLQTTSYNVITIDWSEVADNLWYPIVASNTKPMGDLVGQFLKALQKLHGVEGIHLIGHSLGAHVMGNAAYASKLSVSRITGEFLIS